MFFEISKSKLNNFPYHYQHNDLIINLDNGWREGYDEHQNKLFYKGYVDDGDINKKVIQIANQEEPQLFGNFCMLKCFDKGITIKTDRYRSFPLWYEKNKSITNLKPVGEQVHTDSFVMVTNNLDKIESKFDLIGNIETNNLTYEEVVNQVDDILSKKISLFFKNYKFPLKVFLSGGIDTTTLYSYILKHDIPHELVNYLHTDFDYFYLKNHYDLQNFWGFTQIHHWKDPCILLSGAPGDEFTLRSPTTTNMMLRFYNTSIADQLENFSSSLHYEHFLKYKDQLESQNMLEFKNLHDVIFQCCNIVSNDYQHWHMGNTYTYTPLRDIRIFKTIARLNLEDLLQQIFCSKINLSLIEKNAPKLIDTLSNKKNTKNYLENLVSIYTQQPQDNKA